MLLGPVGKCDGVGFNILETQNPCFDKLYVIRSCRRTVFDDLEL